MNWKIRARELVEKFGWVTIGGRHILIGDEGDTGAVISQPVKRKLRVRLKYDVPATSKQITRAKRDLGEIKIDASKSERQEVQDFWAKAEIPEDVTKREAGDFITLLERQGFLAHMSGRVATKTAPNAIYLPKQTKLADPMYDLAKTSLAERMRGNKLEWSGMASHSLLMFENAIKTIPEMK